MSLTCPCTPNSNKELLKFGFRSPKAKKCFPVLPAVAEYFQLLERRLQDQWEVPPSGTLQTVAAVVVVVGGDGVDDEVVAVEKRALTCSEFS